MTGQQEHQIQPSTETALPGTLLTVYLSSDEESYAHVAADGTIRLCGEEWWVRVTHAVNLRDVDDAIAGADDRFGHADAPYNPTVLALLAAARKMRAALALAGQPAVTTQG